MSYVTYLLECADGSFYVGCTNNLEKRIKQHNSSKWGAHYTKIRRPVVLKYSEEFQTLKEARRREAEIKGWRREKKLALINKEVLCSILSDRDASNKFMKEKKFNEKIIIIRSLEQKDLKIAKKFQDFINSFVAEDAQIIINKRVSLDEEKKWLKEELRKIKLRHTVFLVAEYKNEIIGTTSINSGRGRQAHVGGFGITIKNGYRRMGLGNYLMGEIIKLAKKELKPRPQIFELEVFPSNRAAINLYKKWGFGEVARIPKTIEYKGNLIDRIIMVLSK